MATLQGATKAAALIERGGVRKVAEGVYEASGSRGDIYRVTFGPHRPTSCTCPAGSVWARGKLRRYGSFVCYHVEAVARLRREGR